MIIQYGYADGIGEFYISINSSICNVCCKCINECPEKIFEIYVNEINEKMVKVKDEMSNKIGYICPGQNKCGKCVNICELSAIKLSW
jgi:ferredoxin